MKCKDISKLLSELLLNDLPQKNRESVEIHLAECESCYAQFESFKEIWTRLGEIPDKQPSETLRARFNTMLDAYIAGQEQQTTHLWRDKFGTVLQRFWPQRPAVQFGLALAALFFGLFVGYQLNSAGHAVSDVSALRTEVYDLRQLVATSLLQNDSSTERLRGVSYSYGVGNPDRDILQTLLNTLNYDPNLNVRLAAIDALSQYYDEAFVRRGLIDALSRQTSPLVQIALIDLLGQMKEKRSVQTLSVLRENETFNQSVRKAAGTAIERIQE